MWRSDKKCGYKSPLPDGSPAQCDPDGENPCCDDVRSGYCGNTYNHCQYASDYRIIYREWKKSGGKLKWRYDKRCGYDGPLPDGTPVQCDPDGENPCCDNRRDKGACGNTFDHCSCYGCTDYRIIHQDWQKSEGRQKWRYDGRCGSKYPLPDGRPSECNPNGKPCCNHESKCVTSEHACLSGIDYRVVKEVRESEGNCTVAKLASGFWKAACFNESSLEQYFKCTNSDVYYQIYYSYKYFEGDIKDISFTKVCENDPNVYQACGHDTPITNTDVLCGGFICVHKEEDSKHKYINCTGDACKPKNRECISASIKEDETICDDKCNKRKCEDESNCNGYHYGIHCKSWGDNNQEFFPVQYICDDSEDCEDGSDEQDCNVTDSTVHMCTHSREDHTVPINDNIRCTVLDENLGGSPYCLDYMDQTNCSDSDRVGGYCEVNSFMASVSKYILCNESIDLCDDGVHKKCINVTSDCKIHEHRMCDGFKDCSDGSDEVHDMCGRMSNELNFKCTRRFKHKREDVKPEDFNQNIPVSWIMDNIADCINGEDENKTLWSRCPGIIRQVVLSVKDCQDVYKCPQSNKVVSFDQLCDGIDSCGDGSENRVCRFARDFPVMDKIAPINGSSRTVCDINISTCKLKKFIRPWGDVFGEVKTEIFAPNTKVSCSDKFGEEYLFLGCMDLCEEANVFCPLSETIRKLEHNSCPGQYPNRTFSLGGNSFLTFLDKFDSDHYHQDFYQCNNSRCVQYKQVCDLVDDCGDMSDENNCANHMVCNDTLNSTKHQFIALSQKCDGIYDCFDLSDECNEECGKEILGNWVIKITCWFMGILAILFNLFTVINESKSLKDCETEQMMISKTLMSLIGLGDLMIGLYLVILSVYDSIIFGKDFCKIQAEWLTGKTCLALGIISTLGSQISLFTMTVLSIIRMYGLTCKPMIIPGPVNRKSILKVTFLGMMTITAALAIALVPLAPSLEDYFVQGMHYDPSYKVFVGFPNKERHEKILQAHYNMTESTKNFSAKMTWKAIGEKVDDMFSNQFGNLSRRPVHFYGNDGACLFKYFVRTDDARRSRQPLAAGNKQTGFQGDPVVWTMLVVNLFCFIVITCCYIVIISKTRQSSQNSGQHNNQERRKNEQSIQKKIMVIITTDFLCWVPFIIISGLHNLHYIDASKWYGSFAMIVLPFNSVINPLVYDKSLEELITKKLGWLNGVVGLSCKLVTAVIGVVVPNNTSDVEKQPEIIEIGCVDRINSIDEHGKDTVDCEDIDGNHE